MNKEDKVKRILTTTGYTTQLEKSIVLSYIEELQAKINQLETNRADAIYLIKEILDMIDRGRSREQFLPFLKKLKQILERGKE